MGWTARTVQKNGTLIANLTDANVIEVVERLGEMGSATLAIPKASETAADIDLFDELQILRDGSVYYWGQTLTMEATAAAGDITVGSSDLWWYFSKVLLDASQASQNLLTNPEFETGDLTGWTDSNAIGTVVTSPSPVVLGDYSLKIVSDGSDESVSQQQSVTSTGVGLVLVFVTYVYIDDSLYVGPGYQGRGFYVEARDPVSGDFAVDATGQPAIANIPITIYTLRDQWVRLEQALLWMPPDVTWNVQVRHYGVNGTMYVDALQMTQIGSLSTAIAGDVDYERDITAIINGLIVPHIQDPTYGKVDLNLSTAGANTGIRESRHYFFHEHTPAEDAIEEFIQRDDGPDLSIAITATTRTVTVHPSGKGTDRSATVTLRYPYTGAGGDCADYQYGKDGANAETVVYTLGEGEGADREEGVAEDTSLAGGLVLQGVYSTPPGTKIRSLNEIAAGHLATRKSGMRALSMLLEDRSLFGTLETGDTVAVSIDDGYVQVASDWRIIELRFDCLVDLCWVTLVEVI